MGRVGKKYVLIIDDDVGMLRALNRVLSGEGYMVANTSRAEAAVKYLSTDGGHYFDLIITDLRMPVIDGMGILRTIKRAYPEKPVIIITAFGSPEMKREAYKLGATAFLEKPVDTERLLDTIDCAKERDTDGAIAIPHAEVEMIKSETADFKVKNAPISPQGPHSEV